MRTIIEREARGELQSRVDGAAERYILCSLTVMRHAELAKRILLSYKDNPDASRASIDTVASPKLQIVLPGPRDDSL